MILFKKKKIRNEIFSLEEQHRWDTRVTLLNWNFHTKAGIQVDQSCWKKKENIFVSRIRYTSKTKEEKEKKKEKKGKEGKKNGEGRGRKGIRERQLRVTGGITNDSKSLYTNKRNELFEAYTADNDIASPIRDGGPPPGRYTPIYTPSLAQL